MAPVTLASCRWVQLGCVLVIPRLSLFLCEQLNKYYFQDYLYELFPILEQQEMKLHHSSLVYLES